MLKRVFPYFLSAGLLVACGTDGKTDDTDDFDGGTTSDIINADEGGTVELGDSASLEIPAGSLAEDTTIAVATSEPTEDLPDFDTIVGLVYDLGPDGTTFDPPATLTLPLPSSPSEDQTAVISWLNGDTWEDLDTTAGADSVTAEVAHFTTFVVRFEGMEMLDCSFTACGGDVVGSWTIAGMCFMEEEEIDVTGLCATATAELVFDVDGSVVMNDNNTYSVSTSSSGSLTIIFPAECLAGWGAETCEELQAILTGGEEGLVCSGDPATACDCVSDIEETVEEETGTWSTEGTTLTTTSDGSETSSSVEYCQDGSELKFMMVEEGEEEGDEDVEIVMILEAD